MSAIRTSKKLTGTICILCILIACLCVTTFALVWSIVSVENNVFKTGYVRVNLNNGDPVIDDDELLFEPGTIVIKEFFIENTGTTDVWYKLYFDNVKGGLADVLEITILNGEEILYQDTAYKLNEDKSAATDIALAVGEKRTLTARFHLPIGFHNEVQGTYLAFDLCATAVQTQNNPEKVFD